MKFRRAALVILAANRLRKRNYAAAHDDYGIGGSSMSLCRRLKCGLQNVQFSRPEINLTNSTFLAEAIRKIIHEQTGMLFVTWYGPLFIPQLFSIFNIV